MKKLLFGSMLMMSQLAYSYTLEDYKKSVIENKPLLIKQEIVYAVNPVSQRQAASLVIQELNALENGKSPVDVVTELKFIASQTNDLEQRNVIRLISLDLVMKEMSRLESLDDSSLPEVLPF